MSLNQNDLFRFAILDADGNPQECDALTWMKWFSAHAADDVRVVARDQIGDYEISTVFVGCGLTYFETAIFDATGHAVGSRDLSDTRSEALSSHYFAKTLIEAGKDLPDLPK